MPFNRRQALQTLLALGSTLTVAGRALAQPSLDFKPISPVQPTDNPGKIEVVEFFSYGCPHCAEFYPFLSAWVAKQQGDVVVRKIPVSFNRAAWGNAARLYFGLEATGDLARLDGEVFKAIHQERAPLFDERGIADWIAKKGVDSKKFNEAFSAFGVMSQVKRADQMAQAFRIEGVPAIAIEGKYLVGGQDFNDTLRIADKLIAKAREEKAGKKK